MSFRPILVHPLKHHVAVGSFLDWAFQPLILLPLKSLPDIGMSRVSYFPSAMILIVHILVLVLVTKLKLLHLLHIVFHLKIVIGDQSLTWSHQLFFKLSQLMLV